MKHISLLILLIIFVSCGTFKNKVGHLRYVKVADQEVAVIDKSNEKQQLETIKDVSSVSLKETENNSIETVIASVEDEIPITSGSVISVSTTEKKKAESLTLDGEEEDDIVNQAYRTEKNATAAMIISITAILLGIIALIVAYVFYFKAKSSRYITPKGESRLKISKVFLIIETIVFFVGISLLLASLILF